MKTYNSPLFGDVNQPESVEELFYLLVQASKEGSRVRMWRGQSDISWPVHSSAYRRLAARGKPVTDDSLKIYELRLIKHATHRGYGQSGVRLLTDLELLARLQHHGAATRLVDTTRSALVALWFCVDENPGKIGALIGIHSYYMRGYETEPDVRTYSEIADSLVRINDPYTWELTLVSPRIAAQHSQFLVSKVSDAPSGSLVLPTKDGSTLVVAVMPELKNQIREVLIEVFDIRTMTLFPDLDGFGLSNSHLRDIDDMLRW